MTSYARVLLSGSTDGKAIKIAATATAGTAIHTAISGSVGYDEIYLWLSNTDTVAIDFTLEWGGATDPDCLPYKAVSIAAKQAALMIVPGWCLNNAATVKAFASVANKLLVNGHVNRAS